jgi:myo-inositol 2-dehydrogenase / D-chiro-inositol 1-dehydrogenase
MSQSTSGARSGGPSRREFLKGSTAAVVGASLASNLSISRSAHAAGDDQIKIALIGCGGRGTGAAAQALATKGNVKLIAMADLYKDRLDGAYNNLRGGNEVQDKSRIDVSDDRKFVGFDAYQKAIDAGPDLVILATPPGFRPMQFEAAVKAGKHVFMEKPVATDAEGVRKVLAATEEAKKKNLGVGVGLQRRHQKSYLETIKRLQDGAIGDIIAARVYWNGSTPWVKTRQELERNGKISEMDYQCRNWYYFTWICGDHIVEQHIHNMDVINWLKNGYPVKANGMGGCEVRKGPDYGETFDHHAVEFEYADGTRMFSQCRHIVNCWNSVSEHVHGTKGTADVGGRIDVAGGERWRFRGDNPNPYQVEHDDLFASIRAGNPLNEGEWGAKSTMTAIMGRMATYSGQELSWDDVINSKITIMPKEFSFEATPPVLPGADGMYRRAVPGVTKVV